jgi:hypothetical protein
MPIVEADLAAGRLVCWGMSTEPPAEAWVLHASRRLVGPKISALVGFVCDYLAGNPGLRQTM